MLDSLLLPVALFGDMIFRDLSGGAALLSFSSCLKSTPDFEVGVLRIVGGCRLLVADRASASVLENSSVAEVLVCGGESKLLFENVDLVRRCKESSAHSRTPARYFDRMASRTVFR